MTTSQIKKIIADQINLEKSYIKEHEQIKELLKVGKPINKRTYKLDGTGFKIKVSDRMYHIEGKFSHLLSYDGITPTREQFEKYDSCHFEAAKGRINKLENLDISKVQKLFTTIEKSFNLLRETFGDIERGNLGSFYNPVYYRLLDSIYNSDDDRNKLKLTDFYYIRK